MQCLLKPFLQLGRGDRECFRFETVPGPLGTKRELRYHYYNYISWVLTKKKLILEMSKPLLIVCI